MTKDERIINRISHKIYKNNTLNQWCGCITNVEAIYLVDKIGVHTKSNLDFYRQQAKQGVVYSMFFYFTPNKKHIEILKHNLKKSP